MVSDRVAFSQNKMKYEQKVAEYSNLMKMLTVELQAIKVAKQEQDSSSDLDEQRIQSLFDHEHNISDLELKLDLVSAELEDLRTKLPRGEIESQDDEEDGICDETSGLTKSEDSASRMISNLGAPVLRTILWDMLGGMTQSEVSLIVGCMGVLMIVCCSSKCHSLFSFSNLFYFFMSCPFISPARTSLINRGPQAQGISSQKL